MFRQIAWIVEDRDRPSAPSSRRSIPPLSKPMHATPARFAARTSHTESPTNTARSASTSARFSATSTMSGSGFAVSTSSDDVTAETMSSLVQDLAQIANSSSGADVASTTCRPDRRHRVQ